jgi:hypothetical protein
LNRKRAVKRDSQPTQPRNREEQQAMGMLWGS